jgi:hypothetical protein
VYTGGVNVITDTAVVANAEALEWSEDVERGEEAEQAVEELMRAWMRSYVSMTLLQVLESVGSKIYI